MLGFSVRAKVVRPIGSKGPEGTSYPFNLAQIYNYPDGEFAIILGIDHPVKNFDGMIIGKLQSPSDKDKHYWILAPKSRKYIINLDIMKQIDYQNNFKDYELTCYYEHSAGAVTYTFIKGVPHFLLIKNKNSVNWGFPKGHREKGETTIQTAKREVFEETGIKIRLHDGFERSSAYTASRTVKKLVSFFVGFSQNNRVVLQTEELSDYIWLPYTDAKHALTFRNDRKVLAHARQFLIAEGIIEVLEDEYSLRKVEKGHGRKKKKVSEPSKTAKPADTSEGDKKVKSAPPEAEATEAPAASESTEAKKEKAAETAPSAETAETAKADTQKAEIAEAAVEAEKADKATESNDTNGTDEPADSAAKAEEANNNNNTDNADTQGAD